MPENYPDKDSKVEYVDAEPIGQEAPPAVGRPTQRLNYYYQSNQSCTPCCGYFGCLAIVLAIILIFGSSDLTRGLLYAIAIFAGISMLTQLLAKR